MCSVGGALILVEAVCSHLLPNPCSASIRTHASAHRPFSHPVISVSGEGPLDGNELTRKRPSDATSYWKPERLGATMRVWNTVRGRAALPFAGSKLTAMSFRSGAT